MLTTPKDPHGSGGPTSHPTAPTPAAQESAPAQRRGAVASWVAHHQLGVSLDTIGEQAARALGVVPRAERDAMSEAVTEALVRSARDHLDRAAAAEISGVPRSALERACMAALDRQAQLSIDEARRRNSLEGDTPPDPRHDAVSDVDPAGAVPPETTPAIRVLVTDDPQVAASDWRAQHLTAQAAAHSTALRRLSAQTTAARQDLETTLDNWVRGAPHGEEPSSSGPGHSGDRHRTLEQQWQAPTGIADAAAEVAGGVKTLTDTSPLTLGVQLVQRAASDPTVSRTTALGTHELVARGAAALAANLGPQGRVIADELTVVDPTKSPLMSTLDGLAHQRAALASDVADLAGIVAFARSVAGLDESTADGTAQQGAVVQQDASVARPTIAAGLGELARQALLHERLVAHVVDSLGTLDRGVRTWVTPGEDGTGPPLLAAVGRERLRTGPQRFSHVLVLQDAGLPADVVRRHSVGGDSARVSHIGSAGVTWLLIDVSSGDVVEGGYASSASTLVQDTGSGRTSSVRMSAQHSAPLPWDARRTLELALTFCAVTAGLAALLLGIAVVAHVFLS